MNAVNMLLQSMRMGYQYRWYASIRGKQEMRFYQYDRISFPVSVIRIIFSHCAEGWSSSV